MQHSYIRGIAAFVLVLVTVTGTATADAQSYSRNYDGGEDFRRQVSEWRRGNSELRDKINDLDSDAVDDMPIPVLFGVAVRNLTMNFGDARGGGTRSHEGLDIMVAEGTPIVSPTDAVVIRTGDGTSSGLYVTTAAPGDESFTYMHLSKIADDLDEGDVLEPGDLIGFVGHTGNAAATAPHLHFEIHDEDGDPTDPYPRLTEEFDLDDKIEYLEQIFDDMDNNKDIDALAELLVTRARADFTSAVSQGMDVPEEIIAAMKRLSISVPSSGSSSTSTGTTTTTTSSSVLKVGSRGAAVLALQEFLVDKGVGSASKVKPDGAFGPITRQAVIDYQASVGLVADGVAGPKTLAYIAAHQ